MQEIRIMIVDDHQIFRTGLRRPLELEEDFNIIAEVADGESAIE